MVRTAQEADGHAKLKGHALKAVQSMCWKQAQLLAARRRRIKILQVRRGTVPLFLLVSIDPGHQA